jgi:hypothetical protein
MLAMTTRDDDAAPRAALATLRDKLAQISARLAPREQALRETRQRLGEYQRRLAATTAEENRRSPMRSQNTAAELALTAELDRVDRECIEVRAKLREAREQAATQVAAAMREVLVSIAPTVERLARDLDSTRDLLAEHDKFCRSTGIVADPMLRLLPDFAPLRARTQPVAAPAPTAAKDD